jgi:hypothetical protein
MTTTAHVAPDNTVQRFNESLQRFVKAYEVLHGALEEIARLTDAPYPGEDPQRRLINTIAHDALADT